MDYKALGQVKSVILDMDGVLWRGDQALPGLSSFFAFLEKRKIPFALATNNSSKTPKQYLQKLNSFGIKVPLKAILTSALVTAEYLRDHHQENSKVYVIGMEGIQSALREEGFSFDETDSKLVVVGSDQELTYNKLKIAALLIQKGAIFIACNGDLNFPAPEGLLPGNGATLAALSATTGKKPLIIGKPFAPIFEKAISYLGVLPQDILMVGDRLDTDILGAQKMGMKTVLVTSGIHQKEDISNSCAKPDWVMSGIAELTENLDR